MSLLKPSKNDLLNFANDRGFKVRSFTKHGTEYKEEVTMNFNHACPYESFMWAEYILMINEA